MEETNTLHPIFAFSRKLNKHVQPPEKCVSLKILLELSPRSVKLKPTVPEMKIVGFSNSVDFDEAAHYLIMSCLIWIYIVYPLIF